MLDKDLVDSFRDFIWMLLETASHHPAQIKGQMILPIHRPKKDRNRLWIPGGKNLSEARIRDRHPLIFHKTEEIFEGHGTSVSL